jgi:hypothetical protein
MSGHSLILILQIAMSSRKPGRTTKLSRLSERPLVKNCFVTAIALRRHLSTGLKRAVQATENLLNYRKILKELFI